MSLALSDLSLCDLGVCLRAKDTLMRSLPSNVVASIKPL